MFNLTKSSKVDKTSPQNKAGQLKWINDYITDHGDYVAGQSSNMPSKDIPSFMKEIKILDMWSALSTYNDHLPDVHKKPALKFHPNVYRSFFIFVKKDIPSHFDKSVVGEYFEHVEIILSIVEYESL